MRPSAQLLAVALVAASCAPTQSNVPTSHAATASSSTYASSSAMVPRAGAPSQADIEQAVKRAYANVRGVQRGQERRLHPRVGEGRFAACSASPSCASTARCSRWATRRRRSRFSRSRKCSRWRARSRTSAPRTIEKRIGADATGQAVQLDRRARPEQAAEAPAAGQSVRQRRRHRHRRPGRRQGRGRALEAHPRHDERVRRPCAHRRREGLQVGDRHQRAQPGHQLDPQGGRGPQRRARPRSSISTRGNARSPSRRAISSPWGRRSPTAASIRAPASA